MREEAASKVARPVIAIDGPAGAGKSTLAERLATELGLPYVNTGLMYRAVARRALDQSVDVSDEDGLTAIANGLGFQLGTTSPPSLLIDGNAPAPALMLPDVEAVVSEVSRHPRLREVLRNRQRDLGAEGAVMEGRDIGTAVFPDADVKVFVSAAVGTRAHRRGLERRTGAATRGGVDGDQTEIVTRRDALDARTTPLEPAPDAIVLDTTTLGREETFRQALAITRSALAPGTRRPVGEIASSENGPISDPLPRVAVIGRQNVGKSTLLNRLAGRKIAIEDELPGVTRDRVEVEVGWDGHTFLLTDTGGFTSRARGVEAQAARQAARAVQGADLVLLVVDAQTGVTEEDAVLAGRLQRGGAAVLLVANKCDSEALERNSAEFLKLGLGEPVPVSALHGRRTGDLLDRIAEGIPRADSPLHVEAELRTCLVGRPNVGKSSLFNRLVREERAVVHEEPGTTRDAVDSVVLIDGRSLRFIDTAGLRRQVKTQGLEYYGLLRSLRAIERSHVAILVVDASQGVTSEDKRIAAQVAAAGRGLVVVLNKWDLVPSDERDRLFRDLGRRLEIFPGTPVVRTSALRGMGVGRVVPTLLAVHEAWRRRVPTAAVNREIEAALASYPPPRGVGRIRYGTQVSAGPPSFVLFGATVPGNAYRRYLENRLRRAFGFEGVPVRISFRAKAPVRIGQRAAQRGPGDPEARNHQR
ncbi:MAG: ribosome biogenesis GTPase Der [Actinobacteria bacterium]|nr:ribosome biogenesis GTPase Der [Actinomycetota bacterium]